MDAKERNLFPDEKSIPELIREYINEEREFGRIPQKKRCNEYIQERTFSGHGVTLRPGSRYGTLFTALAVGKGESHETTATVQTAAPTGGIPAPVVNVQLVCSKLSKAVEEARKEATERAEKEFKRGPEKTVVIDPTDRNTASVLLSRVRLTVRNIQQQATTSEDKNQLETIQQILGYCVDIVDGCRVRENPFSGMAGLKTL